jgi:hypothetical protein
VHFARGGGVALGFAWVRVRLSESMRRLLVGGECFAFRAASRQKRAMPRRLNLQALTTISIVNRFNS